jgi:hypothetical protein
MTPNTVWYHKIKHSPEFKLSRKLYAAKRYKENSIRLKAQSTAWAEANPIRVREIATKSRLKSLLLHIYRNIRKRAKKAGLEFNIELTDLALPEICPIFKVPFNLQASKGNTDFSPSVDRIDSSKGYIKGNIQIISKLANCMKWTATEEQLRTFCKGMVEYLDGSVN